MDVLEMVSRIPVPFVARCRVEHELGPVTSLGREDPLDGTGVERDDVEEIWRIAEAFYRTGVTPALQLCIRRRGRIVLNRAIGHARGNAPDDPPDADRVLATTETPMNVFSSAKLVTAMVIHKLDELGAVHLEDQICKYIPEFRGHGKRYITLRHLLSHRAGIPNIPAQALDLDLLAQPGAVCDLLCDMRPASRPGRLVSYHAISGGFVLGEVVKRATGASIREFLEKEVREPLGLRWLHFGVPPEAVDQVARNAFTGPPPPPPLRQLLERALVLPMRQIVEFSNDPRFLTGIVPAANVHTTAEDLSAFLQCMLDGGELDGVRIFQPQTIEHALNEASYREIDLTLLAPIRYGLGPMLGDDPIGIFGPHTGRAFGHLGLSNVFPWADPDREIAVAFLTSGKPILSLHAVRLVQLIAAINRIFARRPH